MNWNPLLEDLGILNENTNLQISEPSKNTQTQKAVQQKHKFQKKPTLNNIHSWVSGFNDKKKYKSLEKKYFRNHNKYSILDLQKEIINCLVLLDETSSLYINSLNEEKTQIKMEDYNLDITIDTDIDLSKIKNEQISNNYELIIKQIKIIILILQNLNKQVEKYYREKINIFIDNFNTIDSYIKIHNKRIMTLISEKLWLNSESLVYRLVYINLIELAKASFNISVISAGDWILDYIPQTKDVIGNSLLEKAKADSDTKPPFITKNQFDIKNISDIKDETNQRNDSGSSEPKQNKENNDSNSTNQENNQNA